VAVSSIHQSGARPPPAVSVGVRKNLSRVRACTHPYGWTAQWGACEHAPYGLKAFSRPRATVHPQAFTLLEVILALSLTVVVLGMAASSIYIHLRAVDRCRGSVEEAQLARALLQRIGDDIRNAVPFSAGSSGSSSATAGASTSSTTSSSTSASSGSASGASATTVSITSSKAKGGLFGGRRILQVETARRPRLAQPRLFDDPTMPARLGDIRTVTYSLGVPEAVERGVQGVSSSAGDGTEGLYRRELDRAEFAWAAQTGNAALLEGASVLLAPEVADLAFTYYNGLNAAETWDSNAQGSLPSAVRISLVLRRAAPSASSNGAAAEGDGLLIVYDMLVDLPNAQAKSAPSSSSSSSSSGSSSTPSSSSGSTTSQ